MATIGTTRSIDQLGRVVVPAELRRLLGINEGDVLEFSARDGELVLRQVSPSCAICRGGSDDLIDLHDKRLCRRCLAEIRAELSSV